MDQTELLADLIARARAAGADAADAVLLGGTSFSVQRRLGHLESLERSESRDLGLRVLVGQRQAIVSSTAIDPAGFAALAERAVAMARVVPEDPFAGLPEAPGAAAIPDLDLADTAEPSAEALTERAAAAEEAALAIAGITNSEGAEAGYSRVEAVLVSSNGFAGRYARTSHSVAVSVLAGEGTGMQRDYDYASAVHLADLRDPAVIGRSAGERAVARLNPVRPATARLPVVYDPRVAGGLIGHLASAVNGSAVTRGTSFLKDRLGERIFAPGIVIRDDPTRLRGLRSRPFDGEGLPSLPLDLVADGVLQTWLLDTRSARQLGLASNGRAARSTSGPPGPAPSNLSLAPGPLSPDELIADIKLGVYVTELIGMGVNMITGDYSRGAAGFMIRDGARAEPVAEITIASTLPEIFAHLTPANDLEFRRGTDAPTVRIEAMTVAGA